MRDAEEVKLLKGGLTKKSNFEARAIIAYHLDFPTST